VALTFSPRSEDWFAKEIDPKLIFTEIHKTIAFTKYNSIDFHVIKTFDKAFANISHFDFLKVFLADRLNVKAIVVGDNFRFGHKRLGDQKFLIEECSKLGIDVFIVPALQEGNENISSTRIRECITDGKMEMANTLLGRSYMMEGVVAKGNQLGRTIGIPTANLNGCSQIIPRFGVYKAKILIDESPNPFAQKNLLRAIVNIGEKPTISDKKELTIEGHILDPDYDGSDLYNKKAGYFLEKLIRPEMKFNSLDELKTQILKDIKACK